MKKSNFELKDELQTLQENQAFMAEESQKDKKCIQDLLEMNEKLRNSLQIRAIQLGKLKLEKYSYEQQLVQKKITNC